MVVSSPSRHSPSRRRRPRRRSHRPRSSHLLVGINDEADTLYGDPVNAFNTLRTLKVQVLRVNLYWGGTKWAVANSGRPTDRDRPGRPRVQLGAVRPARQVRARRTTSRSSSRSSSRPAGRTAARRATSRRRTSRISRTSRTPQPSGTAVSGSRRPGSRTPSLGIGNIAAPEGEHVDRVERAEQPGLPDAAVQAVGKTWRVESAFNYAKICNAVMAGVHSPYLGPLAGRAGRVRRHRPEGQRQPAATSRQSVDPLTFFTQAQRFGMKDFDVYAHHPYADSGKRVAELRAEGQGEEPDPARQHQQAAGARSRSTTGRSTCGSPSTATRRTRPTRASFGVSVDERRRSTCRRRTRSPARTRAST